MATIKGYRLHLNLGASQVRRRLKNKGFGVRKVETAGIGQAVVTHTATGQHRRELLALFEGSVVKQTGNNHEEVAKWTAARSKRSS